MSFRCTDVLIGISIVFKFVRAEVIVKYFIFLNITITCYIFWMLIIIFTDEDLFAIFIAEALFIRCTSFNFFAFFRIFFKSRMTQWRFLFSSDGWVQLVSIDVFVELVRNSIWLWWETCVLYWVSLAFQIETYLTLSWSFGYHG